jgi:hypothetical protein
MEASLASGHRVNLAVESLFFLAGTLQVDVHELAFP